MIIETKKIQKRKNCTLFLDAIASREPGLLVGKLVIIVFKCYKKFQYQAKQAL